jgi:uncharacterized protein YjbI with pentapeptide repeats
MASIENNEMFLAKLAEWDYLVNQSDDPQDDPDTNIMDGVSFENAALEGPSVSFNRMYLNNVAILHSKFQTIQMKKAHFENTKIIQSKFIDCDLFGSFIGFDMWVPWRMELLLSEDGMRANNPIQDVPFQFVSFFNCLINHCIFSRRRIEHLIVDDNSEMNKCKFDLTMATECQFMNSQLNNWVSSLGNFLDCSFNNCQMTKGQYMGTPFTQCEFQNCKMGESIFMSNIQHCKLTYCQLIQCLFLSSEMKQVQFINCDFSGSSFDKYMQDANGLFQEVIFNNCIFVGSSVANVHFNHCQFIRCNLSDVVLNGCQLENVIFDEACRFNEGTILDNVIQENVTGLRLGEEVEEEVEEEDLALHQENRQIQFQVHQSFAPILDNYERLLELLKKDEEALPITGGFFDEDGHKLSKHFADDFLYLCNQLDEEGLPNKTLQITINNGRSEKIDTYYNLLVVIAKRVNIMNLNKNMVNLVTGKIYELSIRQFLTAIFIFVQRQESEMKHLYLDIFIKDCWTAYNGDVNSPSFATMSCPNGIIERFLLSLKALLVTNQSKEYVELLDIISNRKDIKPVLDEMGYKCYESYSQLDEFTECMIQSYGQKASENSELPVLDENVRNKIIDYCNTTFQYLGGGVGKKYKKKKTRRNTNGINKTRKLI